MNEKEYYTYDIKCRCCGKKQRMYFGPVSSTNPSDFKKWASEHSTFPFEKQCDCDNGMIMFHDLVSYGNALHLN